MKWIYLICFMLIGTFAKGDWKIVPTSLGGWQIVKERGLSPLAVPPCIVTTKDRQMPKSAGQQTARLERIRQQDRIRQQRLTQLQMRHTCFEMRRYNRNVHPTQRVVCYRY